MVGGGGGKGVDAKVVSDALAAAEEAAAAAVTAAEALGDPHSPRVGLAVAGPATHCSPRHRMSSNYAVGAPVL